jgi:hypothetical protein
MLIANGETETNIKGNLEILIFSSGVTGLIRGW